MYDLIWNWGAISFILATMFPAGVLYGLDMYRTYDGKNRFIPIKKIVKTLQFLHICKTVISAGFIKINDAFVEFIISPFQNCFILFESLTDIMCCQFSSFLRIVFHVLVRRLVVGSWSKRSYTFSSCYTQKRLALSVLGFLSFEFLNYLHIFDLNIKNLENLWNVFLVPVTFKSISFNVTKDMANTRLNRLLCSHWSLLNVTETDEHLLGCHWADEECFVAC